MQRPSVSYSIHKNFLTSALWIKCSGPLPQRPTSFSLHLCLEGSIAPWPKTIGHGSNSSNKDQLCQLVLALWATVWTVWTVCSSVFTASVLVCWHWAWALGALHNIGRHCTTEQQTPLLMPLETKTVIAAWCDHIRWCVMSFIPKPTQSLQAAARLSYLVPEHAVFTPTLPMSSDMFVFLTFPLYSFFLPLPPSLPSSPPFPSLFLPYSCLLLLLSSLPFLSSFFFSLPSFICPFPSPFPPLLSSFFQMGSHVDLAGLKLYTY